METNRKRIRKFNKPGKISDANSTKDDRKAKIIFNISNEFLDTLVLSAVISKKLDTATFSKRMNKQIDDIESRMNDLFNDKIKLNNSKLDDIIALTQAYLYMSSVYIRNETERHKLHIGVDYLTRGLDLLKGNLMKRKTILVYQKILNELATALLMLGDIDKFIQYLIEAHDVHEVYTCKKNDCLTPIDITSILGNEDIKDSTILLDRRNAIILRRLSNVYGTVGTEFTDMTNSILCLNLALSNDFKHMAGLASVDYITWIANAVKVSKYFITHSRLTEARSHIAVACYVLYKFHIEIVRKLITDTHAAMYAPFHMRHQNTYFAMMICYAKYGIQVLHLSKNKLLRSKEDTIPYEASYPESKAVLKSWQKHAQCGLLHTEGDLEKFIVIREVYVENYSVAKRIFTDVMKWLEELRSNYPPDRYLLQYVRITQDMSKAYKYLAHYEVNKSEQIIMHKQRMKILAEVFTLLDEKIYAKICEEIWIELVLIYSTVLDIYLETMHATVAVTTETQTIIDDIMKDIMYYLQSYMESAISRR